MENTTTEKTTSAKGLARAFLARPWQCLTALALAHGLAFTWMAGDPWGTSADAAVYGMGDANLCIRFTPPPHDATQLWPKNTCNRRVSVGYCLRGSVDESSRSVIVRCSDGRMNTCGAAPGKQCHGGMKLQLLDSYRWGACYDGIANDDPDNFECK